MVFLSYYGDDMALIRFLDGKQARKTATVDDASLHGEGQYRFKKTDLVSKSGRVYYVKAVAKNGGSVRRSRSGPRRWTTTASTNPRPVRSTTSFAGLWCSLSAVHPERSPQ